MPGPTLLPKKTKVERRVFAQPDLWRELDEIADFHQEVFDEMGAKEKVSRNDIIESFLAWAREAYWEDKGGRPTSDKDRQEKVHRHAEKLKKLAK